MNKEEEVLKIIELCRNIEIDGETTKINSNKIIKLPSKLHRKFPREMMVSDDKINWVERIVYGKVKSENPYVAKLELNTHKDKYLFGAWKYAKEID